MKNLATLSLSFCTLLVPASGQIINMVTDMGAHPDGSNPTANAQAFQQAFYRYPNAKIVVPAGNYAIDNSQGSIPITNFNGEVKFEGGAVLLFQTNSQGGFRFTGGTGIRIEGMHGNYPNNPTQRLATQFAFTGSTDVLLKDTIAQNSPGAAIMFTSCIRPKVINATVMHSLADGLIFANSQDAQLINLTTNQTLDNGLAFYNYESLADMDGGTVTNVHVTNSAAHGIAVAGTSNVVVSGFVVDSTRGSAVFVGVDSTYQTRTPDNVLIEHGYVKNAGTIQPPGGTLFGLEYNYAVSVVFSDIQVEGAGGRSVSGAGTSTRVYLRNVRTKGNLTGDDFVFYQTGFVDIADCVSENSVGGGFIFNQVPMVVARRLKTINASQKNSLNRAIWFQDGAYVSASELLILDTQAQPTGFIAGTSNASGYREFGSIQGVISAIPSGQFKFQNYAAAVNVSDLN